jgi:hypothetical protein
MHKAPSVTYPVGPCAWYDRVLWLALMLVALAGLAVAVWGQGPRAMNVAVALVLWLCAVGAVALHLARIPKGQLTWRCEPGEIAAGEWVWQPELGRAALVSVSVVWQGNRVLGLRMLDGRGHTHWVWAQHHHAPHDWLPLRRALISSAIGQ